MNELQPALVEAICAFAAASPVNRLAELGGSNIFDEPLVGFADGDDPLFERFGSLVAPEHLLPRQALAAYAPGGARPFPHVAIVSWILPIASLARLANREQVAGPALAWNHTRIYGEEFNNCLRRFVVQWLADRGVPAVAPVLTQGFRWVRGERGVASTWSERHVAFAAGLGTFSLTDALITTRGMAHRVGSVIAGAEVAATARSYSDYREYCSYCYDGSCGVCIERCPAGAIGPDGHDKGRCEEYLEKTLAEWLTRPGYTGSYAGCGLCQTSVPCEAGIPRRC